MLTSRGWWLLVVIGLQVFLGVVVLPTWSVTPAVIGLAFLAWFGWEWAIFHWRLTSVISQLRVERRIVQNEREVPMVWAGVHFTVRLNVDYEAGVSVPFVRIEDRIPTGQEWIGGEAETSTFLDAGKHITLSYDLRCPSLGILRFEGVHVHIADLHGLFYHRRFLREGVEYLVLPRLSDDEGRQRADKRFNMLPPPGMHRFRRPGTGSELLDLRDYRAGDPPKMIAWKPSARRDRLITKEFESEVPVRCVLFLDTSPGVRLGAPGKTALVQLASLASGVAQAAAANRDLVGLTIFDEERAEILMPARTRTHLIMMLERLALAAGRMPDLAGASVAEIARRGKTLARTLYPELMAKDTNTMPWSRLWLPLLDRRWGWMIVAVLAASPLLIIRKDWLRETAAAAWSMKPGVSSGWARIIFFFAIWAVFAFSPILIALVVWLFHGISGWFNPKRTNLTRRKRLAALLALRENLGPTGIECFIHDDAAFTETVGRFLSHHRTPCPVPLYDDQGRYRFRGERKIKTLAAAILRSVGRARDNELYVLLADLTELAADLAPLLKAARVARSRHHQVLVIVPWPSDVPEPEDKPAPNPEPRHPAVPVETSQLTPQQRFLMHRSLIHAAFTEQIQHAYRELRRELGRAGISVVRVGESDAVQIVLDRLDRLRGMRTRR